VLDGIRSSFDGIAAAETKRALPEAGGERSLAFVYKPGPVNHVPMAVVFDPGGMASKP
jgi:hypothetical protein